MKYLQQLNCSLFCDLFKENMLQIYEKIKLFHYGERAIVCFSYFETS